MVRRLVAGHRVGALEDAIMRQLWSAHDALSGRDLLERLPGPERAYTTIMTVLGRLVAKGLVERLPEGRSFRYRAAGDPEQLAAQAIRRLISAANNPAAVLAHFVDGLQDQSLREELADLLEKTRGPC